jgi:hypothetical protein
MGGDNSYSIETEVSYLDGAQWLDLFIKSEITVIPVKAKPPLSTMTTKSRSEQI